jgi:Integrase core domain
MRSAGRRGGGLTGSADALSGPLHDDRRQPQRALPGIPSYAEVLPDEKATTAIGFLCRAVAFFKRHGMIVRELLTDNGSAYRSAVHAIACRTLGLRHLRTRPRRPQTNGKAERFIRTMLSGWAYGDLRVEHRTHRSPRRMALALQPSPPTPSHRATNTHHPPEQPARDLQLDQDSQAIPSPSASRPWGSPGVGAKSLSAKSGQSKSPAASSCIDSGSLDPSGAGVE